ncbi:MAG: isoprenylcysteine carboxylmethyltransferase family protein [Bacteroidales bacterium]
MALLHSFEKSGNILFKYRGQIPIIIFLLALPIIANTNTILYYKLAMGQLDGIRITILILSIIISLLGFFIRAYTIGTTPRGTSGRNTEKQVASQLNTKGIYSIVRHPLYLGNYLMWAGLLIFTMNIYVFIIISLVYWLYYERIMFAEERFLEKQFGQVYLDWSMKVPAFIPAFNKFQKSDIPFSLKTVLRREYTGIFAMTFAYTVVDYFLTLRIYSLYLPFEIARSYSWHFWIRPSLYILIIMFIVMMILRTLKHHSKLLEREENRD